jgi:hypothetical protein
MTTKRSAKLSCHPEKHSETLRKNLRGHQNSSISLAKHLALVEKAFDRLFLPCSQEIDAAMEEKIF